jgi:hypothetical protein
MIIRYFIQILINKIILIIKNFYQSSINIFIRNIRQSIDCNFHQLLPILIPIQINIQLNNYNKNSIITQKKNLS